MYDLYKNYKKFLKKHKFDIFMNDLGTNKLLLGIFMIFINIGSRYIELRLTKGQEIILKNIAREVLIFTIAFIHTKDLILSLIAKALEKIKDIISENEINKAYDTLKKARGQIDNYNKIKTIESFNNISYK